jgi:archaellum biogenesis ATPase FlaH
MTVSLERVFIKYILKNKKHFQTVLPSYFKNPDIEFVYSIIRKWMIKHPDVEVPTPKQLFEMVHLEDNDRKISTDIFKAIFSADLSEYDETNFIKPKFNTWILINRIREGTLNIVDETRSVGDVSEYDQAITIANRLKSIMDDSTKLDFDQDDDLGSDFDDEEAHSQDHSQTKVKTGFSTLDHVMSGGFDRGTLNLFLGKVNSGKSLWLQNIAVSCSSIGYNVLYLTLEMSEKKVLKRLGSMMLKIPINDYDRVSLDKDYMRKKIKGLSGNGTNLFENKVGKLITKFYAAGTSTVQTFDSLIEDIQVKRGIKFDLIVIDYISLIGAPKGLGIDSNLFMKGKIIAEGLRALAAKYQVPVITATQIGKDAYDNTTITMSDITESRAVLETCDTMYAIIRTPELHRNNRYRLNLLKQRDGDFSKSMMIFELNPNFLCLENDIFVDV